MGSEPLDCRSGESLFRVSVKMKKSLFAEEIQELSGSNAQLQMITFVSSLTREVSIVVAIA